MLELFEIQAQEGPCFDCYHSGQAVVNQDLDAVNGRWPRFAVEAIGGTPLCHSFGCVCEARSSGLSTCSATVSEKWGEKTSR